MQIQTPREATELASALREAADAKRTIRLGGAFSKDAMAGPVEPADVTLSTSAMTRVLQYEPADLTISVEAGLPWAELTRLLAEHRQMIPLDPPFGDTATVGGVIGANTGGPRRRLYGSVRDAVIGMHFATLEGKLVQSGGMVVKNVAGLDMAKLMIGSFGTLAAVAVVNFKLTPIPEASRTFVQRFGSVDDAMNGRDAVLQSGLQPAAVDLLNPSAAERVGLSGYALLVRATGSESVLPRYAAAMPGAQSLPCSDIWRAVREFTPEWLRDNPDGIVTRVSTTLKGLAAALRQPGAVVARAGTGVAWIHSDAPRFDGMKGCVEFAPAARKPHLELWPDPGSALPTMRRIKTLFDPDNLLNRGRLYGRI